jgi:hypothetical protein
VKSKKRKQIIREYTTYCCESCNYSAPYTEYDYYLFAGVFITAVCVVCKILIDCQIKTAEFAEDDFLEIKYHWCDAECMMCGGKNLVKFENNWSNTECPKCKGNFKAIKNTTLFEDYSKIEIIIE